MSVPAEGKKNQRSFLGRTWPLLVLLVFLAVAVFYGESLKTRAQVGDPAPGFSLTDVYGNQVSLADFRGRPVILNFWATWCPFCRYETPAHQAFLERFGDEVAYLAINLREPADKVLRHRAEFAALGIPLEGRVDLLDRSGRVFERYRFTGTPETWVIDAQGRAVRHFIGASTFEDLVQGVEATGRRLWQEPPVGWVRALAASGMMKGEGPGEEGSLSHHLWVGTDRGVFRMALTGGSAPGAMWEALAAPFSGVRSLAVSPDGSSLWVVAQEEPGEGEAAPFALYLWRDGEQEWLQPLPGSAALGVAAGGEGRVYVWTADRGFLVSDDEGATWRSVSPPFQPEFAGVPMAVDPWDPDHVLSAGPGGVWRSRDGGRTWARTEVNRPVNAIAFDLRQVGRVLFADGEGILVSDDGGRTAHRWLGSPQRSLVAVVPGSSQGSPMAAAVNGDFYRMDGTTYATGVWRLWREALSAGEWDEG